VSRSRVWGRGAALGILALLTLTACGSSGSPQPRASASAAPDTDRPSLDRAVEGINVTRDPLVAAMNSIVVVANHVDAVDTASATGDWKRAQQARRANALDSPKVNAAVGQLPALLRAYSAALDALSAAGSARDVPVRLSAAVNTIVRAGRAEADADGVFVRGVGQAWPAYAVLAGTQLLWYERATGDWYDGHKQAAQEYAVLTAPLRTTTNAASESFGKSDSARRAAADQWATTLDEVHPILYPAKK
jgi:hypothetical protein